MGQPLILKSKFSRYKAYKTKESYKWQRSSEAMQQRHPNAMNKIVSVCGRESDMFDYIYYKMQHQLRFVFRAHRERYINDKKRAAKHLRSEACQSLDLYSASK